MATSAPASAALADPFGMQAWRDGIVEAEEAGWTPPELGDEDLQRARRSAIADVIATDRLPSAPDPTRLAAAQAELDRLRQRARGYAQHPALAAEGRFSLGLYGTLFRERFGPRPPSAEDIPDPTSDDLPVPTGHHQAAANDEIMVDRWAAVKMARRNAGLNQMTWEAYNVVRADLHTPMVSSGGRLHAHGCPDIGLDATAGRTLMDRDQPLHTDGWAGGCVDVSLELAAERHRKALAWTRKALAETELLLAPGPTGDTLLERCRNPADPGLRGAVARKAVETIDRDDAEWLAGLLLRLDGHANDEADGGEAAWEARIAAAMRDRIINTGDANPERLVQHATRTVGPPDTTLLDRVRRRYRGDTHQADARAVLDRLAAEQTAESAPSGPAPDYWSDQRAGMAARHPRLWLLAEVAHDHARELEALARRQSPATRT